ncbi:MAG: phosphoadenylyl-sulfate reductase [Rhizobiales bacterium]|nr:phosphoadenylyl-sulfate reductase [Hyphomicrobiales bacterium]
MAAASGLTATERAPRGAPESPTLEGLTNRLTAASHSLDLFERLSAIRREATGRLVFTTSFGLEDQAIGHAIFTQDLRVDVITLDTGRLFPETHQVWAQTEQRYGFRIHGLAPDHRKVEALLAEQGIDGFRASVAARLACCGVRKVEPLGRALAGASGWITGLRAEQSGTRAGTSFVARDQARELFKFNPLFDWTRKQVEDFVREYHVPYNSLHDRGFLSIGCSPCTRAVAPGEPERAGRWWWEAEDKKECGLHSNPRRPVAASAKANGTDKLPERVS